MADKIQAHFVANLGGSKFNHGVSGLAAVHQASELVLEHHPNLLDRVPPVTRKCVRLENANRGLSGAQHLPRMVVREKDHIDAVHEQNGRQPCHLVHRGVV